jgi:hypothetical protein
MRADLERWQVSLNEAEVIAADPIDSERFQLGDVLRDLAAYCVAVIRHKFLRAAPPVWSLADEISYAGFCHRSVHPASAAGVIAGAPPASFERVTVWTAPRCKWSVNRDLHTEEIDRHASKTDPTNRALLEHPEHSCSQS